MSGFLGGLETIESGSLESGLTINTASLHHEQLTSMPELIVNVQNLGSGSDFAAVLAEYLPFLGQYSDTELLLFGILTLIWMLCVIRTLRDAMARSESALYQFISVVLVVVLTPVIGLPLYLAFRPLVYKWEKGLWREALEQKIAVCPHCEGLNATTHQMCVWCGELLHTECKQCHTKYLNQFSYCPECGAPNIE